MPSAKPNTWILTGSLENLRVTREHGFGLIGMKERRGRLAEDVEPGDSAPSPADEGDPAAGLGAP